MNSKPLEKKEKTKIGTQKHKKKNV